MSTALCWPLSVNQLVGFLPVAAENRQHPSVEMIQSILVVGETPVEFDASMAYRQSSLARRHPISTGMCLP